MAAALPSTSSDVDAAVSNLATADPLFKKRIQFHLETKPYSPICSSSSKNFELETLNPSNFMTQRSPSTAKMPAKASGKRSESGVDPLFSFSITFRRIGAGLRNLGNTCYLNSVLQCLTYTEPFAAYCHSGAHKSSCRLSGFCAMCALQNHVTNALQSSGKILSPSHIVKNLKCISRNFRNSRQEDAHEYMVNLLDSMHKCCLPSGIPTQSPSAYEKSLVHKIFGGRLRSQVKCTQCGNCSNKFDPFLDLSLEISKADSLSKALRHFTAVEPLDGGEREYYCEPCKKKVRAYKQLTVHKAPYVLTIHLKRFGPSTYGQKIDKKVDFEPTLNLKPFLSEQEADLKYTLYGVLVHAGWSTHSGHYYCFVRTSTGVWHSLDDNQVSTVSEKTVLSQKAYMLFYVRDRSSTNKRSAELALKDNIMTNFPKRQTTTQPHSNGTVPNAEKKLSISECKPAKSDAVDPSLLPIHVTGNPSKQKNGVDLQKATSVPENNCHILAQDSPRSNGPQQATSHNHDEKQDTRPEENQINVPEIDKCRKDEEKSLEVEGPAKNTTSEMPNTENVCVQGALVGVERVRKKSKSKKFVKSHQYFGRKQLFFTSISIYKKKRHRKCKKRHLNSNELVKGNDIMEDIKKDDQGASTSEVVNPVDAALCYKQSYRNPNKEIQSDETKDKNHCNNEAVLATSGQPTINSRDSVKIDSTSLLMGLKQTPVPRWDDQESSVQIWDIDDAQENKRSHYYDDWDEALDQGRRKKVKKSKSLFNGTCNPFQEAMNDQLQRKSKIQQRRYGNQPLRI